MTTPPKKQPPGKTLRIRDELWDALTADAEQRKLSYLATLENILAAYYDLSIFYEPAAVRKARELLEAYNYQVTKEIPPKAGERPIDTAKRAFGETDDD